MSTPPGGEAARQILITAPPTADTGGAHALWGHLAELATPPPAGRLRRRERVHVGFEYVWTRTGIQIGLWVPAPLAVAAAQAVEAAWPGARADILPARPPLPGAPAPATPNAGAGVAGGRLVLARHEALPLRTDHTDDPLRAVFAAAHPRTTGSQACVQILARPATVSRLANAVQAAALLRAGKPLPTIARMLDRFDPAG
jgi:hypothetical protein